MLLNSFKKIMLILISAGNGPFFSIYSATEGVLLTDGCLLQSSRIHGIRGRLLIYRLLLVHLRPLQYRKTTGNTVFLFTWRVAPLKSVTKM